MDFVFLSHSKRDRRVATQELQRLRQAGYAVWFDEEGIEGGDRWEFVISEAIRRCSAVVLLSSTNSYLSGYVQEEIYLAKHFNKEVYIIDLDGAHAPTHLHWLTQLQKIPLHHNGDHVVTLTQRHPPAAGAALPDLEPQQSGSPATAFLEVSQQMKIGAWTVAGRLAMRYMEAACRKQDPDGLIQSFSDLARKYSPSAHLENRLQIWVRLQDKECRITRAEAILLQQWHRELLLALGMARPEELGYQDPAQTRIYLSYAAANDHPRVPGESDSRWVSNLVEVLRVSLSERLGLPGPRDVGLWLEPIEAAESREVSPDAVTALQNADFLILVASKSSLACPRCTAEREIFLDAMGGSERARGRIFVVQLCPPGEIDIRKTLGVPSFMYPFYTVSAEDDSVNILGSPKLERTDAVVYFERARALSEELAKSIQRLGNPEENPDDSNLRRPKVFVAETSEVLFDEWDKLRNHLELNNYDVLPIEDYERDPDRYRVKTNDDLSQAIAFLQLLGQFPTGLKGPNLPPGGYDELQFQCALDSGREIIRWRPKGLRIAEIRHPSYRAFVQQPDILEMDFNEFKRYLEGKLQLAERRWRRQGLQRHAQSVIAVVGHEWDPDETEKAMRIIQDEGASYDLIPRDDDFSAIVAEEHYCAVVVLSHLSTDNWLRETLKECRSLSLRRLPELRSIGLLMERGLPPISFSSLQILRNLVELRRFVTEVSAPLKEGGSHVG